jgi:hypothetical protein
MATGITGYYYGYQGITGTNINQVQGLTFSSRTGTTGTTGITGTTGTTGMTGMTGIYQGNTGSMYFGTNKAYFDGAVICKNQMSCNKINQVWKISK